MLVQLATETQQLDWGTLVAQFLVTVAAIFGGAGFWEFVKIKFMAKREDKKAEDTSEAQIAKTAGQVAEMSTQMTALTIDMHDLKEDMRGLKEDLAILQQANVETVKYREARDKHDKELAVVQNAIIQSLTGILRERLLENYKHCMEKGYYTKEEREVYGRMYECYTQDPFNGNGVMHQLQPIMVALPWTEEEAKKKSKKTIT
jgi:hypothetical protein